MVEFTYQDYLKYEKFLQEEERKEKENRFIHLNDEDIKRWTDIILRVEKLVYGTDNDEEDTEAMLMEESEPYNISGGNQTEDEVFNKKEITELVSKKQLEESRRKHDELFKSLLNNKENFVDFIKYFIDGETKLTKNNIEKYNRNFITDRYESRHSDIVYKEKDSKTYYLIEHQSSIDYRMPYRMLEYSYEIIRDVIDKEKIKSKNYEFPKVIPIVLYTGIQKWTVPKIIGLISNGKYEDVGLRLKYILIDTNEYSKENLLSSNNMIGYAMQADRSSTSEEVSEAIEKMLKSKLQKHKEILKMINYVFKGILKENELDNLDKQIKEGKVEEIMITVRERLALNDRRILEKGIAQGITQGIAKGIAQGITQTNTIIAKKMISMGMKKEDIHEATGLSIKEIESLN